MSKQVEYFKKWVQDITERSDKNCLLFDVEAVEFCKIRDFKCNGYFCWVSCSGHSKVVKFVLYGPVGSGYHITMAELKKTLKQFVLYTKKGPK